MGARYRMWQFGRLLTAQIPPTALTEVQQVLPPPLFELFTRQRPSDQFHAYSVRQLLIRRGETNPHLLTAALLHDVGKTQMPLHIWERVWIVLGMKFIKQRALAWGAGEPKFFTRAFVVAVKHAAWGAQLVKAAGGNPVVVELIARHQDTIEPSDSLRELLIPLQLADNEN